MNMTVLKNPEDLGKVAAKHAAEVIAQAIAANGKARIILSTGASQNETLQYLLKEQVQWEKVEVFHLDEYINLPADHPASFRRYLKERFLNYIAVKKANFVHVEGDVRQNIENLTKAVREQPIDLAFIGIGENSHIAFNDPPADFDTREAYIVVQLDEACKKQQVGEGCFPSLADVPDQAVSMTVHQIMQSKTIISCVPDKRKAQAVKNTLEHEVTNDFPATMLQRHPACYLYLDEQSASELILK